MVKVTEEDGKYKEKKMIQSSMSAIKQKDVERAKIQAQIEAFEASGKKITYCNGNLKKQDLRYREYLKKAFKKNEH